MINYFLNYTLKQSNYNIYNSNNIFNLFIEILESVDDEHKKKIILKSKFIVGITFYEDLKNYLFKKNSNSSLLEFFK